MKIQPANTNFTTSYDFQTLTSKAPRSGSIPYPKATLLVNGSILLKRPVRAIKQKAMAQSLSKLYIHIVFHIKHSSVEIRKTDGQKLYAYMGSIVKENDSIPILINGVSNHIHILCILSKNISLAKLVEEIKRNSSRWIKTQDKYYKNFSWQGGYAGFSVSPSVHEKTKRYIANQEAHHQKRTFKQEYLLFLEEYGIDFNEDFLWND